MITIEEFAEKLNGREINEEITKEEEKEAKENGLVVVFGASDDLMEFRGAINDEMEGYEGTTVLLNKNGIVDCPRDADRDVCYDDCPYFKEVISKSKFIRAVWTDDRRKTNIPNWTYQTEIPHGAFNVMEDGEVYCRGIVFCLKDIN